MENLEYYPVASTLQSDTVKENHRKYEKLIDRSITIYCLQYIMTVMTTNSLNNRAVTEQHNQITEKHNQDTE